MDRVNVITELRNLQRQDGWITDRGLEELSQRIDHPVHELYGVASFYPEFHLKAPPRVTVRVCTALPCQMRGSELLMQGTSVEAGKHTDVQLIRAPCLGACDSAPVAALNERLEKSDGGRTIANLVAEVNAVIGGAAPPTGTAGPKAVGATATTTQAVTSEGAGEGAVAVRASPGSPYKTDPYATPAERYGAIRKLVAGGPDGFAGVLKMIKAANLRGMGGAGKAASRKWEQVAAERCEEKYVVCNADESEPGTLKDREILRTLPHLLVEAMAIAGLTVGATQGYIYLRHEYHEQHEALLLAIREARAAGILGEDAAGSGRTFKLDVFVSPGGYILGEATALLEALEGKRGQPRNQIVDLGLHFGVPSYNGLHGQPTVVNNVETYIYVPHIVMHGPDGFKAQGINGSEGLKWASVCGDVLKPGVFEVPLGTRYRDMIELAGGVIGGWERFKAFAPSGPTNGFRPAADLDETMDFHDPKTGRAGVGSGAIIVLDRSRCMVDAALNFTRFFRNESCGKCVPCRAGSGQMVNLIKQVRDSWPGEYYRKDPKDQTRQFKVLTAADKARRLNDAEAAKLLGDVDLLEDLMVRGSICGLGQVVAMPFQSVRKYWKDEVDAHVRTGRCPTRVCQDPREAR